MTEGIIISTAILVTLVIFIILFMLEYQRKKNLHNSEKERLQSIFKQELLKAELEIQEQTLKNISQEIHDNVGQVLSLAKIQLSGILPQLDTAFQQKIETTKNLVGKAIRDLRTMSHTMNMDHIGRIGLAQAIEQELSVIQQSGIYETVYELNGPIVELDKRHELIIFRVVQEAINNIFKHAEAKTIRLKLHYGKHALSLTISDDGKGFESATSDDGAVSTKGIGIENMQNRCFLIGANFDLSSSYQGGTIIVIKIPYTVDT